MASPADLAVHLPTHIQRKKKVVGQQKRQELEREVSMLRKMLEHEQKVHEILDRAHQPQDRSSLQIPNFIPPKMKELLAELAMVEEEITRLEGQIGHLQTNLDHEKELTKNSKLKQRQQGSLNIKSHLSSSIPPSPIPTNKGFNETKTAFETKALHFISKAIKGDYNLDDFRMNEKLTNPRGLPDQKENNFHEEVGTFREKTIVRRSGILKPPSPLREPRHATPKREHKSSEIPSDLPPKPIPTPIQTEEENINKWSPNKLSENIMKCLIFVFVRLLRTSRAIELEKSGPVLRSPNLFSLSFRVDNSSNMKANGLMLHKESRQQDPFGIFDSEESIPRDIGPYKNLVRFTASSLDPKFISNSSSIPLLKKLRMLLNTLEKVEVRYLSHPQKLAFWINMYNACIMHGYIQYGVPSSPEKLLTLMNKATLNIGGNTINAQAIEHYILRKPTSSFTKEKGEKDDREGIVRQIYGLETSDPNVTFALCCGTFSSPAVRIYTSESVVSELEKSKLEYLMASIIVTAGKKIALPELLLRNTGDFAPNLDLLVEWLCHQLPTSGSLRKSMVECFRGLNHANFSTIIEKIPYDYEFQYLLAI